MRNAFKYMLRIIFVLLTICVAALVCYEVYKNYILEDSVIETEGNLSITYDNGNKIYVDGQKEVTFRVINSSDKEEMYYIEYKNPEGVQKDKVKFTLSDGINNISGTINEFNTILDKEIVIGPGKTKEYTLIFDSKLKFSLELNIGVESGNVKTFADILLANNSVREKPYSKVGSENAVKNEGLIKDADDFGTTYYFRGNVKNNYLKLGDTLFRIVRINGDGSVKVVLDGVLSDLYRYNNSVNDYSFSHSEVLTVLDKWLEDNFSDYKDYISNNKFCNDNNANNGELLAHDRVVVNHIATYMCLGDTISTKVGLLTVDEMLYAGASLNSENTSFYLYNEGLLASSYSMTGYKFNNVSYFPFMLSKNGQIVINESGETLHSVKPVINIIKTATVTGSGTIKDPYILTK